MAGYLTRPGLYAFLVYGMINSIFVYKYSSRLISLPWAITFIYLAGATLLFFVSLKEIKLNISKRRQNALFIFLVAAAALCLTLLMFRFDPATIRVGRYPAMHDWLSRLFDSEFPYNSDTRPSGFPFLFVVAMPFYFLGDLGLLQVFGFLVFAGLVYLRFRNGGTAKIRCILLLIATPVFVYEIVVRSELFSNMVLVLLYFAVFERLRTRAETFIPVLLGLAGGLILSTRGIVIIPYLVFFSYLLKKKSIKYNLTLGVSIIGGFLLTLVPFICWNRDYFIHYGPFAIQSSYIPGWLLAAVVIVTCWLGLSAKSLRAVYSAISFLLAGIVAVVFFMAVIRVGWHAAVIESRFDISYFCFTIPFLLISLKFNQRDNLDPDCFFSRCRKRIKLTDS
jgi:hypothetical protein